MKNKNEGKDTMHKLCLESEVTRNKHTNNGNIEK